MNKKQTKKIKKNNSFLKYSWTERSFLLVWSNMVIQLIVRGESKSMPRVLTFHQLWWLYQISLTLVQYLYIPPLSSPFLPITPFQFLFLCFKNFLRFKNKSPKLKKITFPNWMQSKSFNFILAKANQFQWRTIGEALLATRCCQRNNKASSKTHCSLSANQKASIWWKLIRTVY
jgi:hypothetical protein